MILGLWCSGKPASSYQGVPQQQRRKTHEPRLKPQPDCGLSSRSLPPTSGIACESDYQGSRLSQKFEQSLFEAAICFIGKLERLGHDLRHPANTVHDLAI